MFNLIKKLYTFIELIALACMFIMVLVVFTEVVKRYVFQQGFAWSQEIATTMMVWFGFIGIAIGISENIHMKIELCTRCFTKKIQLVLDKICLSIISIFGLITFYYGILIMQSTAFTTMPATKLPSSILYVILPITGILTIISSLDSIVRLDKTNKYKEQK